MKFKLSDFFNKAVMARAAEIVVNLVTAPEPRHSRFANLSDNRFRDAHAVSHFTAPPLSSAGQVNFSAITAEQATRSAGDGIKRNGQHRGLAR